MDTSADDFYSWRRHPITQVIMSEYSNRIQILLDELVGAAGQHPVLDAERAGAIKAYKDVINISYSEIEESHGD